MMHSALAVAFVLAALVHPWSARAQPATSAPALPPGSSAFALRSGPAEDVPPRTAVVVLPDTPAWSARGAMDIERISAIRTPSLSRHVRIGGGIGAVAGAALGLWVISIADCGGSNCTTQRVVGVAGNALGGAAIGALIGGAVYLIRR